MNAKIGRSAVGSKEQLVSSAIVSLEHESRDTLYTLKDIIPDQASDLSTIREYGNALAVIVERHSIDNINEAVILKRALDANDPEMLEALGPIRQAYENMIRDTLALPVPLPLVRQHLDLLNTYQAIQSDIHAMEQAFNDPLLTLLRVKRYEGDALGLVYAFANLYDALKKAGVVYTQDEFSKE
jgi:hypothetical protein